jgi:protein subunit release factor A
MKIDKKIFKVDVTKGTGAGGQHKNKVETCAVVTHIPSGLQEKCEETRSKIKNIETAYKRLVKRLQKIALAKKMEELNEKRREAIKSNGVIRTYNYKQNTVKDHRTGETANLKKVMDGNLKLINK